jgi:hypothetical protein
VSNNCRTHKTAQEISARLTVCNVVSHVQVTSHLLHRLTGVRSYSYLSDPDCCLTVSPRTMLPCRAKCSIVVVVGLCNRTAYGFLRRILWCRLALAWTRSAHRYSETNVMHILFSLLRIKGLYVFRAVLVYLQEAVYKRHLACCVRVPGAAN